MIEKGMTDDVATLIGKYVLLKGGEDLIEILQKDEKLMSVKDAKTAVDEMKILFQYCNVLGITDKVIPLYSMSIYVISHIALL